MKSFFFKKKRFYGEEISVPEMRFYWKTYKDGTRTACLSKMWFCSVEKVGERITIFYFLPFSRFPFSLIF